MLGYIIIKFKLNYTITQIKILYGIQVRLILPTNFIRKDIKPIGIYPFYYLNMLKEVILWSAELCPFAHRARIVLKEKKVDADIREENLSDKSQEFKAVYKKSHFADPYSDGKVPTLQHKDVILTQSEPVSWYIAETFNTGSQLIPDSPLERAKIRYFITEVGSKIVSAYYGFIQYHKNPSKQKEIIDVTAQALQKFDQNIVGPFVLGQQFSLADILFWPWFDRWIAIEHYIKPDVKPTNYKKIATWIEALNQRDSIKETSGLNNVYIEGTRKFFEKTN